MLSENKEEVNGHTVLAISSLVQHVLVNDTRLAWECLTAHPGHVDIVTDNAGYELFADMCLADFLISTGKATMVRLCTQVYIFGNLIYIWLNERRSICGPGFDSVSASWLA